MQISNHNFLITGGASGLGAATARRLVSHGGRVIIADLNVEQGNALAAELGDAAKFSATDVTDAASVAAAVKTCLDTFGAIHALVNCAGIAPAARIVGRDGPHDLALFERVVRINLVGTFNCLRLAAAAMADNPPQDDGERGVVVITSSIAATDGQIGQAAYAASKAGVAGLTLPAARELARIGVRVVTLAPGVFDTPIMAGMSDEVRDSLAAQVPFPKRLGQPDEFAALVEHAITNRLLNGSVLRIDGGLRMS